MANVTQSDEERPAADGPPWPVPGPDTAWWRRDADVPPSDEALAEASRAGDSTGDAGARDAAGDSTGDARARDAAGGRAAMGPYSRPPRPPAPRGVEPPNPPGADPLRAARPPRREIQPPTARVTPSAPIDTTPFDTLPIDPVADNEPPAPVVPAQVPQQRLPTRTPRPPARGTRAPRPRRDPRQPWLALPSLLVLAMLSAFLSWVSAEPFWLAVGHGSAGTATVLAGGTTCRARFVADGGAFEVSTVDVAGLETCTAGATVPARMVSAKGERAYATDVRGLNLRWGVGFGLVLVCGLLIAWLTGVLRFSGWRRGVALGLSQAGPLTLAAAMLALSF